MRLKISVWLALVLWVVGTGAVWLRPAVTLASPGQRHSDMALAMNQTICKSQPIPDGWVITGETNAIPCSGTYPTAWIVQPPASPMVVCGISPIPYGWVIVNRVYSLGCPGAYLNALTIRRP